MFTLVTQVVKIQMVIFQLHVTVMRNSGCTTNVKQLLANITTNSTYISKKTFSAQNAWVFKSHLYIFSPSYVYITDN